MRPQPLIRVANVEASSEWYQRLLNCRGDHGGAEFERLTHGGVLVMQLHQWDVDHHHWPIGDRDKLPHGNGVLRFEVDDFDAAERRAIELGAEVVMPRHRNPPDGDGGPNHWEIWLRDRLYRGVGESRRIGRLNHPIERMLTARPAHGGGLSA